ncbi:MAG: NrfD/PsrC family molybdoenzyme membrane anchor subunit [Candidatus Dormibacteria bacterium]
MTVSDGRGAGRTEQRDRGGRRGGGGGERSMVPEATFTSYYGRQVVKASPWERDIPVYLFLGGLAGGSSLLAAGADLTGRPALRRASRLGALGSIGLSYAALVHDLGKPSRFINMLRVAKPTSPMSMGTWILTAYGPAAGMAVAGELSGLVPRRFGLAARGVAAAGRPAGLAAAVLGSAVASYTAVLLADTATPSWHEGFGELPFVFVGSAAAAAGGLGMLATPVAQAGPARRLAAGGALLELVMERRRQAAMGITSEPLETGRAGLLMRVSRRLTMAGAFGAALLAPESRGAARLAGVALLAGSVCTRFGIFEAGQVSARDPKYTVLPQRTRMAERARR